MKYLQATVTMLSLINPVVSAAILSRIEAGQPRGVRFTAATKGAVAIFIVLSASALIGTQLLGVFGVSLDVFIDASRGRVTNHAFRGRDPLACAPDPVRCQPGHDHGSDYPFGESYKARSPGDGARGDALAVLVTWIVLLLAGLIQRRGGAGLLHDLTTRFMGLIVLAMGFQFGLAGLKAFFETG